MSNDDKNDNNCNDKSEIKLKSITVSKLDNEISEINADITINDRLRNILFYLMCIEYCISSCDGGIIPQQNKKMQKDFNDEDSESRVGLYGSIDYIGRIIGAAIMSYLINKLDRRIYFSGCCFFKAFLCIIPLFTKNYYINIIARLLSGLPQILLTGYGTIWADQFGKRKKRSMMLQILQFSAFLGIMVGYGLGIICNFIMEHSSFPDFHGWRLSFIFEGVILGVLGMLFIVYPKIYFSSTFYLNENDDFTGREKSLEEITKTSNTLIDLWRQLPQILCCKIFIFMSIGNTVAFFGMRVIQFYADKYMDLVLKIEESRKFFYYIVLCMTGPVLGIIICGIIMTKIGGYASKNGMIFILILNIIAAFISIFITVTLNSFISLGSAWLFLFCYAAVTPLQGGVIISSLPKELKGNGYSINMFFLNALGSFPSSYVFALICDFIKDHYPKKGDMRYRTTMRITMFYNFFGLALIIIASIFRFKLKGDLGSSENKEIEKEDDKNEKMVEKEEDKKEKMIKNENN